jgi:hypothetical protein
LNKNASFEVDLDATSSPKKMTKSKLLKHQSRKSVFTVAPMLGNQDDQDNQDNKELNQVQRRVKSIDKKTGTQDQQNKIKNKNMTDKALQKEVLKSPLLSARALFYKVHRLQEVFCVQKTSRSRRQAGNIDVQRFENICLSELDTSFGHAQSNRLFRHLLGVGTRAPTSDMQVNGEDLVKYFMKGINIGIGKPRETFAERSTLHRHITTILKNLDSYANRAAKYEIPQSSTNILFARQVSISSKHSYVFQQQHLHLHSSFFFF